MPYQRGGGRLAMSTRDRDREFHPHQFGQHFGASDNRYLLNLCLDNLGIVIATADDMTTTSTAPTFEPSCEYLISIPRFSRNSVVSVFFISEPETLISGIMQNLRDSTHAGTPDSNEMKAFNSFELHLFFPKLL